MPTIPPPLNVPPAGLPVSVTGLSFKQRSGTLLILTTGSGLTEIVIVLFEGHGVLIE